MPGPNAQLRLQMVPKYLRGDNPVPSFKCFSSHQLGVDSVATRALLDVSVDTLHSSSLWGPERLLLLAVVAWEAARANTGTGDATEQYCRFYTVESIVSWVTH